MAEVKESGILIQDVETKNIMTKSTLPVPQALRTTTFLHTNVLKNLFPVL